VRVDSVAGSDTAVGFKRPFIEHPLIKYRPSRPDRDRALSIEEPVFRSVEESVRSIVPTNLSFCSNDASSIRSFESSELFYAPFSFENDLFTSYVYKRNFRVTGLHIKQVQKTPEVIHSSGPIKIRIPQTVETSKATALSQDIELDTNLDSFVSASPGSRDTTSSEQDRTGDLISAKKSIEDLHRRPSDIEIVLDHEESVSVVDPDTVDTTQSIAKNHVHTSNVCFDTVPLEAVHTDLGIKRKPLPSSAKFMEGPKTVHRLAHPINENFLKQMDSRGSQIERGHKELPSDPNYYLFTQLRQGVLEAATEWARNENVDSMLYLPARTIASPNTTLALKSLHNHNRSLFRTIMQVFGFMRGTVFMVELADALIVSDNPVTQIGDTSLQHGNIVQSDWTSTMLHDQTIVNAAAFKDTATAASLLNHIPTVLQLACAARSVCVVEYLLSLGHPLIPLDWKVHPFILATKRRCRPILELFFKLAKDTVPQLIKNLSLAMVVNQDCALSEYWLDADQNDNKRIGEDVNIVSFLLANGASPNGKDQYGISVLSMAIQSAYSLNPLSIQIVDILLHKGADFGFQEAELMFMAPPKAFELIIRRHKLRLPL
jgi:hypothetical protein